MKPQLPGDWRTQYRVGGWSATAHLFAPGAEAPMCRKAIKRARTLRDETPTGRPCTDCLVAAIRAHV